MRMSSVMAMSLEYCLICVSSYVIYFAAQIKQYSSDIAITLLILILGFDIETKELTARRAALFATVGALVVWLSHPSVFILAGVGGTLALSALLKKDWARVSKLAVIITVWLMSFAAFYLVSLKNLGGNETLEKSWAKKGTFMPLLPHSL